MWLIVLTGFLAPLGVLISWNTISDRKKLFYILFLLQQVAMLGIFVSLDLFLYYAFWELSLVPMTLLIATFGRTVNRRRAAIKYFLYTFIPSAILLVGMLWLYASTGTFDFPTSPTSPPPTASPATPPRSGWPRWPSSLPSPSKSPSSRCTAGSLTPSPKPPPPPSWSSPANSASTPSCASPSASSPNSPITSPR